MTSPRLDWRLVLTAAAQIVESYDTGVTLRQLFYRLVAAEILSNTRIAYQTLSSRTAAARREGRFPDLVDRTRSIHRPLTFDSPARARRWLAAIYRRDRTAGQAVARYLGVEKAGIVAQLQSWFEPLGIPILALGGYFSQSYIDEIRADVMSDPRPSVLIYAGDFDPSGEDIDRDFVQRTGCFDRVMRIALTSEQVDGYELPEQMGKPTESRATGFVEKHGRLVQVELDALPPDELRRLYQAAIDEYWDDEAYQTSLNAERDDREALGVR